VSLGNCMTSIFGGFVIFSYIGFMAGQLDVKVDEVATSGTVFLMFVVTCLIFLIAYTYMCTSFIIESSVSYELPCSSKSV
jgi:hypothetical protein